MRGAYCDIIHATTRCVIHNGLAINLISTIDTYDKLVLARGIFKKIYFNVCHFLEKKKIHDFFFPFFYITLVMRNSKGISH
jgi:hypothetical protein